MGYSSLRGTSYRNRPDGNKSDLIPDDLKAYPQWVAWDWGEQRSNGKREKVPIDPHTGRKAKPNDLETWGTYSEALAFYQERDLAGVGFVFSADDPYTGLDFDDCIEDGEVHPSVEEILERLGNPYTDISPSGKGLKAVIRGKKPGSRCSTTDTPWGGKFEVYDAGRFFTITGNVFIPGPIGEAQQGLDQVYQELCPEPVAVTPTVAATPLDVPKEQLLEKARNANVTGPIFAALFDRGDTSASNKDNSASGADLTLMMMLAFWTGGDRERMEELFNLSALGQREKWRGRPDYRESTITLAISRTSKVYTPRSVRPKETRTRDKLREYMTYARLVHPWAERSGRVDTGATDYALYRVLLRLAYRANSDTVGADLKTLTLEAGLGSNRGSTSRGLARLEDTHRLVERVEDPTNVEATRYRILPVPKWYPSQIFPPTCAYNEMGTVSVPLKGTLEIRNTSPSTDKDFDKNGRRIPKTSGDPVRSVGKVGAMLLDLVHAAEPLFAPAPVPVSFLAQRMGLAQKRLRARHAKKLLDADLIEEEEGGYRTPEDVEDRVAEEVRVTGCAARARRQKERFDQQRTVRLVHRLSYAGVDFDGISYRTGLSVAEVLEILVDPDPAPSVEEMREYRAATRPDGVFPELEREAPVWGTFLADDDPEPVLTS